MFRPWFLLVPAILLVLLAACAGEQSSGTDSGLSDAEVENIVERSYQYVALYNVINKGALDPTNPQTTGGFNRMNVATQLLDHNMKAIARPNNDTMYITAMLDLRKDPVILDLPVFDSKYVSLMAVAYDHYVNVPMSTRFGDFGKPEKVLFYSARTEGYGGEPIEGIDRTLEMTGDFVIAVLRVMPHANEPARFKKITETMQSVELSTLSEYQGGEAKPIDDVAFPDFGATDADVFGINLLEVMQFVFNHVTFDADDEIDEGVLAAYRPLGVEPGKQYDPATVTKINGERFRTMAEQVQAKNLAYLSDPMKMHDLGPRILQAKGETDLEALVAASAIGPIGLPMAEAMYPSVPPADGEPMNALHDYVITISRDNLPPANAFWSVTLYDTENGFFIPNDRKKYSVGENSGMKLSPSGGIDIYIAAEKPGHCPEENWLPITRQDQGLDVILRIYAPDLERVKSWPPPRALDLDVSQ
jgi:hypothetical protein